MYKVSVIIPIYNVEHYLLGCLDSIRTQTLREIELLLVDDCGSDNSVQIAQKYIADHELSENWHILCTQHNSGPAIARNLGINTAQGEYISFVDGDDWIEPPMLEALYLQAQRYEADLSSCAAILDYPDGSHSKMYNPSVGSGSVSIPDRKYILRKYVSNFTTTIFHRQWLIENGIEFPNSRSGEDSCFMGCCYLLCSRIAQCDSLYYHYVIHPTSISHAKHVFRWKDKKTALLRLLNFAKERDLWREYRLVLSFVFFKKAIVSALLDVVRSYF